MEVLANDSVLFMDEPTSGLDASSSLEVMTLIKNEALLHGKCVALVIHQPRNEIFHLLDDLLLLKGGSTLYYGSVAWFRENIIPQLAVSAFDSIGDRIIDHITCYDDLYVPKHMREKEREKGNRGNGSQGNGYKGESGGMTVPAPC